MICVEEIWSNYFTLFNAAEVLVWATAVHEKHWPFKEVEDITRLHHYGSRKWEGVLVFVVDKNYIIKLH